MMQKVIAKAPTRIDLAGGTLDLWPIHNLLDKKLTVNIGISLYAVTEVILSSGNNYRIRSEDQNISEAGSFSDICNSMKLPLIGKLLEVLWRPDLPPIELTTRAQSPAGAGLGGSSALAISVAAALLRARRLLGSPVEATEEQLVAIVQDVESKIIFAPTGCQDYWGAVRGGINLIEFPCGPVRVKTFRSEILTQLADQMILVFSGKSRASSCNNWSIFRKVFDRDPEILRALNKIGAAAWSCGNALKNGNLDEAIAHSKAEWCLRRGLWPDIETLETKKIDEAALSSGAEFSRICGAGGGGVMIVFANPSSRDRVTTAIQTAGGTILPAEFGVQGLLVENEKIGNDTSSSDILGSYTNKAATVQHA